jgi:hypothetical protein
MNYLQGLANKYIEVKDNKITFTLQKGTIPDVGENGMQVADMLLALKTIFESLDNQFPCMENRKTINALQEAYDWQLLRTIDRERRGVEGKEVK